MQTTSVLSESGLAPLSLKKKNRSCKATVYTQYLLHYTCHISYYDIIYIYIIRKLCISSLCYITSFLFLTPSLVQIDLNHCKNTWKTSSIESPHFVPKDKWHPNCPFQRKGKCSSSSSSSSSNEKKNELNPEKQNSIISYIILCAILVFVQPLKKHILRTTKRRSTVSSF